MSTVNCLCHITRVKHNNSWLIIDRKRLNAHKKRPQREDKILIYAPILIGMCKAYFTDNSNKNDDESDTINIYNSDNTNNTNNTINNQKRTIVPNYYGMESEKQFNESRVVSCGQWIVWNNKKRV